MKKLQGKPPSLWPLLLALLVPAMMLLGCPPTPVSPPPDADASAADAGPMPPPTPGGPSCASWCAHAAILGCAAARPTPAGAPCTDVCMNTLDGPAHLDVVCRTAASSCEAADACETPDPSPMVSQDGGAVVTLTSTCSAWCAHAKALNCVAAKPSPKGASCSDVCSNAQSGPAKWNLRCRIAARTCAAADACEK